MKKIIILLIMLVMFTGCQEESVQKGNSRETLLNPEIATIDFAKQWVVKYGTSPESVDNYNHTFVRLVVDQNAKVMNKLVENVKGSTEETGKQLSALSAKQDALEARIMLIENSIRLDRGKPLDIKVIAEPYDGTATLTPLTEGDKDEE